jgi:predicted Fe-Mo cluster-binding NifX family protein
MRFVKAIKTDKIITAEIGERARKKLQEMGIAVEIKNSLNDKDKF